MDNTNDKGFEESKQSKENDEYWEKEKQIKFSVAISGDVEEIQQFLKKEFYPDEPIFKNAGVITDGSGSCLHRQMSDWMDTEYVTDPVIKFHHSPGCIIARSTVTGYIVGVKIGRIVSRKDKIKKEDRFDWIAKLPKFLNLPHFLVYFSNLGPTMESLRLGPEYMFQDLEDANMIYYSQVLSVGSEARGKGLGTELMRRGYKIAKEAECEYTHIGASSSFTSKILRTLGNWKVLKELRYEDMRHDKKGRPFFIDTGVHEVIEVVVVDHRNKGFV